MKNDITNKEYYKEELLDFLINGNRFALQKETHELASCEKTRCTKCCFFANGSCADNRRKWLNEEYVEPEYVEPEPEIDWSKIPVDTPILVRNNNNDDWTPRYFSKYENGLIYAWCDGATSWSAEGHTLAWKYAKLVEEKCNDNDEFAKNSSKNQVDWNKVPLDTPIFVRDSDDEEWKTRYFAEYNGGKVFAWADGMTSSEARGPQDELPWLYAKLTETA